MIRRAGQNTPAVAPSPRRGRTAEAQFAYIGTQAARDSFNEQESREQREICFLSEAIRKIKAGVDPLLNELNSRSNFLSNNGGVIGRGARTNKELRTLITGIKNTVRRSLESIIKQVLTNK